MAFLQFLGELLCWHDWIVVRDPNSIHMQCMKCTQRTVGWTLKAKS